MTSSRRTLSAVLDPQANIAAGHLASLETNNSERMDVNYPLRELTPSPSNPRRLSLDAAGVDTKSIENLKLKDGEDFSSWVNRIDSFLVTLPTNSPYALPVWSELLDLAISIATSGLLQPIVVGPDKVILTGERRWAACLLANKPFNRVITRSFPKDKENLIRLIENIRRSDLSVAETAASIRFVMEDDLRVPCGPTNTAITIEKIQSVIGVGSTQAAYYRSICRLPTEDPLLVSILAGAYSSLRTAYEDASKRLREINSGIPSTLAPASENQSGSKKAPAQANSKKTSAYPEVKTRIPGTEGGLRIFQSLASMDGLSEEATKLLSNASASWPAAPDKARKNIFATTLRSLCDMLDPLDAQDEPDTASTNGGV